MEVQPQPSGSQSIDRATELLSLVAEHHKTGAPLSVLMAQSGLTRPTVYRLLAALARAGLVEQDPDSGLYFLGAGSYSLGVIAADRFGLHPMAELSVARLADMSEDTAFFSIRKGTHTVCLNRSEGRHPIRPHILDVGQTHPLGVAAHGIAILAALSDEEIEVVIQANAKIYAEKHPNLTPDFARELVAETRERGWSLNRGFFHKDAWAVGVVVRGLRGEIAGALSIGSMKDRLGEDRQMQIAELLRKEAAEIESKFSKLQSVNQSAGNRSGASAKKNTPHPSRIRARLKMKDDTEGGRS